MCLYFGNIINFLQVYFYHLEYYTWLYQVTAFLPAMQFSFVPWQYDEEVVEIAREYVRIHEEIVTPIVLQAAEEVSVTGKPYLH